MLSSCILFVCFVYIHVTDAFQPLLSLRCTCMYTRSIIHTPGLIVPLMTTMWILLSIQDKIELLSMDAAAVGIFRIWSQTWWAGRAESSCVAWIRPRSCGWSDRSGSSLGSASSGRGPHSNGSGMEPGHFSPPSHISHQCTHTHTHTHPRFNVNTVYTVHVSHDYHNSFSIDVSIKLILIPQGQK